MRWEEVKRHIYLNLHLSSYEMAREKILWLGFEEKRTTKKIMLLLFLNIVVEVHFHHSK